MEGRLYRPRERTARAYWHLFLGCVKDKGPSVTFILGPYDSASPQAMDDLAVQVATTLGVESANPRHCFTHRTGYEAGVVAALCPLSGAASHGDVSKGLRAGMEAFFAKHRTQFDSALES